MPMTAPPLPTATPTATPTTTPAATPRITCLIPTFNRKRLLARAIASALVQDDSGVVVHVFDNHSSDGTGAWARRLAERIPALAVTVQPTNVGAFANFLAAFASVRTPYFSILSDDDLLLPGFYRRAVAYLDRHPGCGLYCGDTVHITDAGSVRYSSNHNWDAGYHPPGAGAREMKRRGHPTWTGIVFRREVLERTVLLDDAGSPTDFDFELQAARQFGIYVSRRPSAALTMGAATASANKPLAWVHPAWEEFMRRNCPGYGRALSREVAFLSDRYFADLLSLLVQPSLPDGDRRRVAGIIRGYRYWSGMGTRLVRWAIAAGSGRRLLRAALLGRKVLKLVEQPRLTLNFLKLRRVERRLRPLVARA